MNPKRFYYVLIGGIFLLAVGSVGITWVARNWLSARSLVTVNLKLDILGLQQKQRAGIIARGDLETYKKDREDLVNVIPRQKDQVDLLSQLQQIGDEADVTIGSITFPSSELGNAAAAQPAAAPSDDSAAKSTSPTPTPAPAAAKSTVTQAKPVDGISGLYAIQITLSSITQKSSSKGLTYEQTLSLLKAIEHNKHIFQMTNVNITPQKSTTDNSTLYQIGINLNTYLRQ